MHPSITAGVVVGSGGGLRVAAHGKAAAYGYTRVSSSCQEAIRFIESDDCDPEVLLASVRRTCPVQDQARAEDACEAWYGSIPGMREADRRDEVHRCATAQRRLNQASARMAEAHATSKEERALCFQCRVKCSARRRPAEVVVDVPPHSRHPPDGSAHHCRPRSGKARVQLRQRLEATSMTAAQWVRLTRALQKLKQMGTIAKYNRRFKEGMPTEDPVFMNFQQLPWYRRFIFDFETELQVAAGDCDVTLPYWSACSEVGHGAAYASDLWSPAKLGGRPVCQDGGSACASPKVHGATQCPGHPHRWCLGDGVAVSWQSSGAAEGCACVHRSPSESQAKPPSCAALLPLARLAGDFKDLAETLDALRATLLCGSATGEHSTLCHQGTTAFEPLFWFNYAFMDRLFLSWQRYHYQLNDVDTTNCFGCEMKMTYYNVPLAEWFGRHDEENQCILVPKSDPVACVSYAGPSAAAGSISGSLTEAMPGSPVPDGGWDCNAGFSNWKAGWSAAKKAWCCKKVGRGCYTR